MIVYKDNVNTSIYLPSRFENRVVSHIVANFLSHIAYFRPPLYLFIEGTAGEGKTIQVIESCVRNKITLIYLSSSELSSSLEGRSKEALEEAIAEAVKQLAKSYYVAILIDDFHLGNSSLDAKRTTANADFLISCMMNLADNYDKRIPVILTGNDFSTTYYPLMRDGRADIYEWILEPKEKREIAFNILKDVFDNGKGNISQFIEKHLDQSISFFAQIRNDVRRLVIQEEIAQIKEVGLITPFKVADRINDNYRRVPYDVLIKIANERMQSKIRKAK